MCTLYTTGSLQSIVGDCVVSSIRMMDGQDATIELFRGALRGIGDCVSVAYTLVDVAIEWDYARIHLSGSLFV